MSQQPEVIVLFPPTHEQENPTFHVEASLADAFIGYLAANGLQAWEPPQKLDKMGPDRHRIIEVQLEANTPMEGLERLLHEFLRQSGRL